MNTPTQPGTIVDLFAGPGGWSEGLRMLGLSDIGIEWDRDACSTRKAAGHLTVRADVSQYPPEPFAGAWGLIASPPCQDFSVAGKRAGRDGARGELIDTVPAWVEAVAPEWFVCEQVPPALDVWHEHAYAYRGLGYSTWCGILNAADFGVPQTRKRAILIGGRTVAHPPVPTHEESASDALFDDRSPWVTMADALGWPDGAIRHPRGAGLVERYGERPDRSTDQPSFTIGSKARSWTRAAWCWNCPATTVCGDPRLGFPGHHDENARSFSVEHGAVRLEVPEALTLQSFRPDYPVAGSRSSQFTQIGNAVPPLLAAHLLSSVTGVPVPALERAS